MQKIAIRRITTSVVCMRTETQNTRGRYRRAKKELDDTSILARTARREFSPTRPDQHPSDSTALKLRHLPRTRQSRRWRRGSDRWQIRLANEPVIGSIDPLVRLTNRSERSRSNASRRSGRLLYGCGQTRTKSDWSIPSPLSRTHTRVLTHPEVWIVPGI